MSSAGSSSSQALSVSALAFQATTYTLTDQLNQILQLVFIRCLDALKPRWSVVAIDVNTIQKQDVPVPGLYRQPRWMKRS